MNMKTSLRTWTKGAAICAITGIFTASLVTAADPPPPGAPPAAPGQPAPGAPPPGRPDRAPRIAGGGGGLMVLDEQQRETYREASQKSSEELRTIDQKIRAAQKDLVHAALAEKYDEKAVREKADAIAKLQADLIVVRAKAFSSVAPTLKPEQREQLESSRAGAALITGGLGGMGGGFGGPGATPPPRRGAPPPQ